MGSRPRKNRAHPAFDDAAAQAARRGGAGNLRAEGKGSGTRGATDRGGRGSGSMLRGMVMGKGEGGGQEGKFTTPVVGGQQVWHLPPREHRLMFIHPRRAAEGGARELPLQGDGDALRHH